jgi:hypothetical protein
MGLVIHSDLDTNLGTSKKVYIRIENINLNRTFGKVKVAVTYWINQEYSEQFKHSIHRHPLGQISNFLILYDEGSFEGIEVTLPTYFEFDLAKPKRVKVPVYEVKEISEEVPYITFDELGRKQTAFRTVKRNEKVKVGEKDELTQVLDFDIEKTLIAWCYGQVKARLAEFIPGNLLEDC